MSQLNPIAYLNERIIDAADLKLPVSDMGIVHGVSITEMLRTFRGRIFEWDAHWKRLENSAAVLGIPLPDQSRVAEAIKEIVDHNFQDLGEHGELGVILSATPGPNRTYVGAGAVIEPTFFAHTFELPGELWAPATLQGQHLAISSVPQVPDRCVPVAAKTRSRVSWYLADRDVQQRYPGSRAIVCDQFGFIRETTTANLFLVRDGELRTPAEETVLPGVTRAITIELAKELGLPFSVQEMTVDDLLQSQEIFTTSTPYCLLGVSRLNSAVAGLSCPGEFTQKLLEKWNERVGVDIHEQLRQQATSR
ncbi:aminotransferase class IV [Rubinisphaera margarita]|uniref:aminotransferase class IV n=1 Tax=Rubinisphaera margarita TaxID=2909586 RepID=UPI001EE8B161|nr:aminotransferase class IV [Rubinisphaera margarita]MCG6158069.1 aminotransferase class IV [Rubinisphaera margarita]